mmetsp:Transcript_916/g.912  ORF Transcript_916/g.912 Transcript_916/m.912 type:complete len:81 (-) Transcript_916:62-304(-)
MFHRTSQKLGRSIVSRGFHSNRSTILSKSTPLYITFVAVGAVAFEFFYGKASETVWAYFNQGKLFHHARLDRFKLEGQEE